MNISVLQKGDYENKSTLQVGENKPKQSQSPTRSRKLEVREAAGKLEYSGQNW